MENAETLRRLGHESRVKCFEYFVSSEGDRQRYYIRVDGSISCKDYDS